MLLSSASSGRTVAVRILFVPGSMVIAGSRITSSGTEITFTVHVA